MEGAGRRAQADEQMDGREELPVNALALGEDHISDLLDQSWGSPDEVRANVEYMRALVEHMHSSGRAPDAERLEVNRQCVVTGGNHRVLAAWLLRWPSLRCFRCDHVAGWRVPLDEQKRSALEAALDLKALLAGPAASDAAARASTSAGGSAPSSTASSPTSAATDGAASPSSVASSDLDSAASSAED
uniref:Uncharacterized protein n=1 Tax=Zooxanthella nutricula TaxID=1333877 RepID=A0A7S2QDW8_9DINO